ncbi:sialin-like [Eurosta solidaginis]|uniref:sialin-like n=1 Tax=Eurosta solidaginis TaxID=178769 RepID=UPI00353175FB
MITNGRFSLEPKDKFKGRIIGYRHLQCLLLSIGLAVIFSMRVNISVAIVAMMDNKGANPDFPEYKWSQETKSHILSSFFCGYIFLQIPAGGWSRRFGGHLVLLLDVIVTSMLALLTPLSVSLGGGNMLCALRFCQGLLQGVTFPTIATLISKWAPAEERSVLQTISFTGAQVGIVIMLSTSGMLCSSSWGWPGTFYLPGLLGLVWAAVWFIFGASSPRDCKLISADECAMIEESLGHDKEKHELRAKFPVPWKQMLTSKHFLVLIINNCAHHWCFWTLLTQIPSYIQSVLGKDIKSNAFLSSLPYISSLVLTLVICPFVSWFEKSKLLHPTVSRKIFNTIALWTPIIPLITLGFLSPEQSDLAVGMLTIIVAITTFIHFGFAVNHLDLAPNFAGTLMGIITSAGNVMSIFAPLVVGYIVTDTTNVRQWRVIFSIAAALIFFGNLTFLIFGTAKIQLWNEPQQSNTLEIEPLKGKIIEMENTQTNAAKNYEKV